MNRSLLLLPLFFSAALVTGCPAESGETSPQQAAGPAAPAVPLPKDLFLDARPAGAEALAAVKTKAKVGDEVLFEARVGGRKEPFTSNLAMFVVTDLGLESCAEMDMGPEGCPTPWDYCCESKESLLANTATIQVPDAEGRPLAATIQGQNDLEGLKVVVVKGTVKDKNDQGVFLVDAQGLWIEDFQPSRAE